MFSILCPHFVGKLHPLSKKYDAKVHTIFIFPTDPYPNCKLKGKLKWTNVRQNNRLSVG